MFLSRVPPILPFRLLFITILSVSPGHVHDIVLKSITPPPSQCTHVKFSWSGGTPPFFVNLVQQGGRNTRYLGPTNDSSFPWDSDFITGTVFTAQISGSNNSGSNKTDPITMSFGPNAVCLGSTTFAPPTASTDTVPGNTLTVMKTPPLFTSTSRSSSNFVSEALPRQSSSSGGVPSKSSLSGMGSKIQVSSSTKPSASSSVLSSPLAITMASGDTMTSILPPHSDPATVLDPLPSTLPQQAALHKPSDRGRLVGITIGCLAAALLAALAICFRQKRRRANERSRITSITTLDTLAFTATTWSDLSPSEPGKPRGANKKVTEWRADLFARNRDSPGSQQSGSSSPWVPFPSPRAPFRKGRGAGRVTSLSTIPEAGADSSMPSPVESDDSGSTAPSLFSYPPLVPHTVPATDLQSQDLYPPTEPPAVQVPVNPFRARLLAATGRGATAAWNRHSGDPFL